MPFPLFSGEVPSGGGGGEAGEHVMLRGAPSVGVIIPNMRSSALGRLSGGSVMSWIMVERMKGPPRVVVFEDEPTKSVQTEKRR